MIYRGEEIKLTSIVSKMSARLIIATFAVMIKVTMKTVDISYLYFSPMDNPIIILWVGRQIKKSHILYYITNSLILYTY